jgi:hypothetical protein
VLLLAGSEDQLIAPPQVLSTARLVGTPQNDIKTIVAPSNHLGLFMGRNSLTRVWPDIVSWLDRAEAVAAAEPLPA